MVKTKFGKLLFKVLSLTLLFIFSSFSIFLLCFNLVSCLVYVCTCLLRLALYFFSYFVICEVASLLF